MSKEKDKVIENLKALRDDLASKRDYLFAYVAEQERRAGIFPQVKSEVSNEPLPF
jgi:hypothetical protein